MRVGLRRLLLGVPVWLHRVMRRSATRLRCPPRWYCLDWCTRLPSGLRVVSHSRPRARAGSVARLLVRSVGLARRLGRRRLASLRPAPACALVVCRLGRPACCLIWPRIAVLLTCWLFPACPPPKLYAIPACDGGRTSLDQCCSPACLCGVSCCLVRAPVRPGRWTGCGWRLRAAAVRRDSGCSGWGISYGGVRVSAGWGCEHCSGTELLRRHQMLFAGGVECVPLPGLALWPEMGGGPQSLGEAAFLPRVGPRDKNISRLLPRRGVAIHVRAPRSVYPKALFGYEACVFAGSSVGPRRWGVNTLWCARAATQSR